MAQMLLNVCGRCLRPKKVLYEVDIKASNPGLSEADMPAVKSQIEYTDLMCLACWKRLVKYVERGIAPAQSVAGSAEATNKVA